MDILSCFNQMVEVNQQAFEEGHYNMAYHALATALYCAEEKQDWERVMEVAVIARRQGQWIDEYPPEYEHSSHSSSARSGLSHGIFEMLRSQAQSKANLMKL